MKKICIIGCYFGKFRSDFAMWLKSCEYNNTIDFLIFSDCSYEAKLPSNVRIISMTFDEIQSKFRDALNYDVVLPHPYKLCDYKPMYGFVFQEYIQDYDFFGYSDFDMIFGDIRSFLTEEILEAHDRIYYLGHLSLYRNTKKMQKLFTTKVGNIDYRKVISDPRIFIFDEIGGMLQICKYTGIRFYTSIDYADITKFNTRFKLASDDLGLNRGLLTNHNLQIFLWDHGKLYFCYVERDIVKKIEIIYIHFSGRKFASIESDRFLITRNGFIPFDDEVDKKTIVLYNKNQPYLYEWTMFHINHLISRIRNHSKYYRM